MNYKSWVLMLNIPKNFSGGFAPRPSFTVLWFFRGLRPRRPGPYNFFLMCFHISYSVEEGNWQSHLKRKWLYCMKSAFTKICAFVKSLWMNKNWWPPLIWIQNQAKRPFDCRASAVKQLPARHGKHSASWMKKDVSNISKTKISPDFCQSLLCLSVRF